MEKLGDEKEEFYPLNLFKQVQVGSADGEVLRAFLQLDDPSAGHRSTHSCDLGDIDDSGAMNAPKLAWIQFFDQTFDRFGNQGFALPGNNRSILVIGLEITGLIDWDEFRTTAALGANPFPEIVLLGDRTASLFRCGRAMIWKR